MNQEDVLRLPPQAIEAEQSILGSMMLDNRLIDECSLQARDFYRTPHQIIYEMIRQLDNSGNPPDVVTVSEALAQSGELDRVGGLRYLGELAKNTPNAGNIAAYAKIVSDRATRRRLIESANDIIQSAYQSDDAEESITFAENELSNVLDASTNLEAQHIGKLLPQAIDEIEQRFKTKNTMVGIPTGFEGIDKRLLGLVGGELTIIAARPAMGKTAFAMNIAQHIGTHGGKSLFFSLEMPVKQLIYRMMSSFGVEHKRVRSGQLADDDWPRLTTSVSSLSESGIFIEDSPSLSVSRISAVAKKLFRKQGKMPIFIDYLQIMGSDEKSDNRNNEVSKFTQGLKAIAKNLDVPVVLLSQLNRSLENRPDKRPKPSDLRDSGSLEQDAGDILFIYRDEQYNSNTDFKGYAEIIIGKARNAEAGKVILGWQGEYQRFNNLDMNELNQFNNIKQRNVTSFKRGGLS